MNPGTEGVIQRRARPRPNDWTLPAEASESSARCTVRWLLPSARASAELDHDSPSARKASTVACSSSTGRASTTRSRARRGAIANPSFVALTAASGRSSVRSRPTSTRNRARCDSSTNLDPNARATSVSLATSPGHASPSVRARANNTGRLASETTVPSWRTTCRQASTMKAFDATNASTSSSRRNCSSPFAIKRAAGAASRSRNDGHPSPPPRIRTCGITASGSCLGWRTPAADWGTDDRCAAQEASAR